MKTFSTIKQRIRQFADNQNISIKEIYQKTGISDGTLSNSSGLNEESLLKIFSFLPNISADWLLTGNGEMIKREKELIKSEAENIEKKYISLLEEYNAVLKENQILKEKIARLEAPKPSSGHRHSA